AAPCFVEITLQRNKISNLSKLQLKTGDLDPRLFSRLRHLQKLDLSDNLLDKFPNSLTLPDLRVLNCNNNKLEDVTALKQFPLLEELTYENNVYLTVSYPPPFMKQRGKQTTLVTAHWEKFFRDQLPEKHTAEQVKSIKKKFLKSVQTNVVYGPSSLSEFTRWRVGDIPLTLLFCRQGPCSCFCMGLIKTLHGFGCSCRQVRDPPQETQVNPLWGMDGSGLQGEPLHFLQCHSKGNSREDFKTQLWSCVFEPVLDSGTRKGETVATCGGESVCLIDCETGTVLKKYKVATEEFFSVAWTTLTMVISDSRKKAHNILAAAGRRGIVKLIHVAADFCYGEIKAHKKPIATVCFSPTQETHLFTASYDKRIALWDIGIPDCDYNFKASQLLVLEAASIPLRIALVPTCPEQYLLAGCEDGCFAWNIKLDKGQKSRPFEAIFQFPDDESMTTSHRVDGLAFLNDDVVVSKSSKPGCIYLWSWSRSFDAKGKGCQRTMSAVILAELEWSTTDMSYLTLSTCPAKDYVFCGDEKGSVWMVSHGSISLSDTPPCPLFSPQILKWPELRVNGEQPPEILVNNVVADPAFTYLVVLTSVNITAIWKKS
uniref:Leucine-rich repeat and WD repeat-containing protein 1 n=1 Tax=Malurus cyaneus samueli TaxID=2593467 RepID=A0A8C5T2A9_9PASS